MKFPTATVILVSAALLFVLWNQTREQPAPLDAESIANLSSQPVERGRIVDWVVGQLPRLCEEATGASAGNRDHDKCLKSSKTRQPTCRRAMADQFPGMIASEQIFRNLSVTMMDCLVQQSRLLGSAFSDEE
jgi:hypothetical protein